MTDKELQIEDNVVLYVRPSSIDEDTAVVDGEVFEWNGRGKGLSVNWLECFQCLPKSQQLEKVRKLIRLDMKSTGKLAELNVGMVLERISDLVNEPRFIHSPLSATEEFCADPSHCELAGLPPPTDPARAALIGDEIAKCVSVLHETH